jgi:hypothetical protein
MFARLIQLFADFLFAVAPDGIVAGTGRVMR